jgi:hypothetical protein
MLTNVWFSTNWKQNILIMKRIFIVYFYSTLTRKLYTLLKRAQHAHVSRISCSTHARKLYTLSSNVLNMRT